MFYTKTHAPYLIKLLSGLCVCVSHNASLRGEDDNFVERCELLEEVVDARAFLEPPACRQLQTECLLRRLDVTTFI